MIQQIFVRIAVAKAAAQISVVDYDTAEIIADITAHVPVLPAATLAEIGKQASAYARTIWNIVSALWNIAEIHVDLVDKEAVAEAIAVASLIATKNVKLA